MDWSDVKTDDWIYLYYIKKCLILFSTIPFLYVIIDVEISRWRKVSGWSVCFVSTPLSVYIHLDFFFPALTAFPVSIVQDLPNVALVLTAHGGHIAFLQGFFPRGENYMERLFGQFVHAVFEHPKEIKRACGIKEEQMKD